MSLCVYYVLVLFYVQVAALRWAEPPSKEFLPTVYKPISLAHARTLHSAHTVCLCVTYGSHNKQ
jgi:hypothetical protein